MIESIDDLIRNALSTPWPTTTGKTVAIDIAGRVPMAELDWDEGAGESWARILVS